MSRVFDLKFDTLSVFLGPCFVDIISHSKSILNVRGQPRYNYSNQEHNFSRKVGVVADIDDFDRFDQLAWFARITPDYENIRTALESQLTQGKISTALRIGDALTKYWYAKGYIREASNYLNEIVARGDDLPAPQRALALRSEVLAEIEDASVHALRISPDGEVCGVTTTSGLAWKIPGRAGDSPILGAGLYVDNDVGACGSTGRGEANLYNLDGLPASPFRTDSFPFGARCRPGVGAAGVAGLRAGDQGTGQRGGRRLPSHPVHTRPAPFGCDRYGNLPA